MSRFGRTIIGALVALVLLVGAGVWALQLMRNPASYTGTDCEVTARALRVNADTLSTTPPGGARYEELSRYDGELRAELKDHGCVLDENDNLISDPDQKIVPSATPSTTPTSAPTTDAKAEAKKKAAAAAKAKAEANKWTPHYYTLDKGKRADRDFGPGVKGGKKAVDGTKAEKAKALKQIRDEFKERMLKDPALLCGNGGLILHGKDGGKDCVDKLVKSKSARDKYYDRVMKAIKSTKVEKRYAQYVESAVMVVPKDGVPRIVKIDTYRSEVYYVFVVKTKAGKTYSFRLECGFQWDTGRKIVPRKYTPVTRTPYTPVMPCVRGSRDSNGKCGHTPHNYTPPSGGCKKNCGSTPPHGGCKSNCGNTAKDPSKDPAQNGNAGNGGGRNANPGPGATTKPVHAPTTPRKNPAPPASGDGDSGNSGGSDGGGSQPAPTKETAAPSKDKPAEGCDPAPGKDSC